MESKSPFQSKTLWAGYTGFIAGVVALVLHYTDATTLGPEFLGAAWTDVFTSAMMIVLRYTTKQPISSKDSNNSGTATTVALLLSAVFILGCGVVTVSAKKSVGLKVSAGPPCKIEVTADDKIVATVTAPKKCTIKDAR